MTNVARMFGFNEDQCLRNESSNKLITDDKIGIEVEVEGLLRDLDYYKRLVSIPKWWDVVEDGSLRDYNGLYSGEFVFKVPMFGRDVVEALQCLRDRIGETNDSCRTSVHVHLDVRDMSYSHLLRFLCTYLLVEPVLFSQVSPERVSNPYCVPLRQCKEYLTRLGRTLKGDSPQTFISQLRPISGIKYTALNFLPMSTQGSIEFRHKEGTTDPEDILNWVNIILSIKRYAMSINDVITSEELCGISDNYVSFVSELFRDVKIDNLNKLSSQYAHGAAILAKGLLHSSEERNDTGGESYERSMVNSYFWKTVPTSLREHYFSMVLGESSPTFEEEEEEVSTLTPTAYVDPVAWPVNAEMVRRARQRMNEYNINVRTGGR